MMIVLCEDGDLLKAVFGADLYVTGELVFTTAMTGYQELPHDQAFGGQILPFTFPVIGAAWGSIGMILNCQNPLLFSSSGSASGGDAKQLAQQMTLMNF